MFCFASALSSETTCYCIKTARKDAVLLPPWAPHIWLVLFIVQGVSSDDTKPGVSEEILSRKALFLEEYVGMGSLSCCSFVN